MSLFLSLNPQPIISVGSTSGQGSNSAVTTASSNIPLVAGNAYRLISNVDCYLRFSKQAVAPIAPATASDFYLPAKSPMILIANGWDQISALGSAAGTLGIVQVQLPI